MRCSIHVAQTIEYGTKVALPNVLQSWLCLINCFSICWQESSSDLPWSGHVDWWFTTFHTRLAVHEGQIDLLLYRFSGFHLLIYLMNSVQLFFYHHFFSCFLFFNIAFWANWRINFQLTVLISRPTLCQRKTFSSAGSHIFGDLRLGLTTICQPFVTTLSMTLHGYDKQNWLFVSKRFLYRLYDRRERSDTTRRTYLDAQPFVVPVRYELQGQLVLLLMMLYFYSLNMVMRKLWSDEHNLMSQALSIPQNTWFGINVVHMYT